jgi:hypothetical protein
MPRNTPIECVAFATLDLNGGIISQDGGFLSVTHNAVGNYDLWLTDDCDPLGTWVSANLLEPTATGNTINATVLVGNIEIRMFDENNQSVDLGFRILVQRVALPAW